MGAIPTAGRAERLRALRPHHLFEWLERRGWRWPLAVLGSVYWTVRQRRACLITPHDGRWLHRFREGRVVSPWIFEYAPSTRAGEAFFWQYEPRAGDTVVDIGAGIGGEAMLCAGLVGRTGRVVAAEANPTMFKCLKETVRLNRLTNASIREVAVMGRPGVVTISDDGNLLANHIVPDEAEGVRVDAMTLDALADSENVGRVALLKLNIEGAERPALQAAAELLARTDHAVVACHDFLADPDDPDDPVRTREHVLRILSNAGFAVSTRPEHPLHWVRDFVYATRADPGPAERSSAPASTAVST